MMNRPSPNEYESFHKKIINVPITSRTGGINNRVRKPTDVWTIWDDKANTTVQRYGKEKRTDEEQ